MHGCSNGGSESLDNCSSGHDDTSELWTVYRALRCLDLVSGLLRRHIGSTSRFELSHVTFSEKPHSQCILLLHLWSIKQKMGLRMDDIHTPSVASGPTTGSGSANGVKVEELSLMDLAKEKTKVEEELSALGSVLDSVCNRGTLSPLLSANIDIL